MYIKIKGIFIRVILLVQLAVLLLGYGFLGYYLRFLFRESRFLDCLLLLSISLAATWAIAFNLGGLIAIAATALIAFLYGGLVPSAIATGAASAFLVFCLWGDDYEEPDRKDENLNKLDWLVTIITIAFAAIFALLLVDSAPTVWISYLLAGGVAGAAATVGLQTKSVNLSRWKTVVLLLVLAVVGLAIGGIFDSFWFSVSFRRFS
ncbi:hypothetical protein V2H45_08600 [Tumidithrix elongata RA019]|uniref:Uncharacterized protein n=1 Tax=Tumidithrix elongata BACA0141 TaxID=2716417 RepID=A0AAW9Q1V7_9CYAN|nr:hypothetical protein [Tumidithrix elongata RA019]